VWATDHRYGLPVTDRGLQRRGARRAASCVLRQHTECYGFAAGEASRESDTFTKWKRPSNNRMKLTGSAMAGGAAPAAYPRVLRTKLGAGARRKDRSNG
jgi:hypothetical protein